MILHLSSPLAILALTSASVSDANRNTALITIFLDVFTAVLLLIGVGAFFWGKQLQKPDVRRKFFQIIQKNNGSRKGTSFANIVAILPIGWLLLVLAGVSLASAHEIPPPLPPTPIKPVVPTPTKPVTPIPTHKPVVPTPTSKPVTPTPTLAPGPGGLHKDY